MDQRMIEFIRALRATGIRISLAESQDAMYGVETIGITDQQQFRAALKTTLIKESRDQPIFDYLFPLFFTNEKPPLLNIAEQLSPQDRAMLEKALQALGKLEQKLRDLLQQLLDGKPLDAQQLDQAGQEADLQNADHLGQQSWMSRKMQRQMGMSHLQKLIHDLLDQLKRMGMSPQALEQLQQLFDENMRGLSKQIAQHVGATLAQNMAYREPEAKPDLLDIPFSQLEQSDLDTLREQVKRLAARLRSRAALRQRRALEGTFDPRKTLRQNMKYDGVPLDLKFRSHHVKPRLVLICDISTSMRYCAEFLLTLIYELQDQVAKTNSYIFISDMVDISMIFQEHQPREAVAEVLKQNRPGYYSTDLGNSLKTFQQHHLGNITSKTTVVMLGDGRNNFNDPQLGIIQDMQRKSRRLLWFNPETPHQWGTGDSDMDRYAPLSDGVYRVTNLRELAAAVDNILKDG